MPYSNDFRMKIVESYNDGEGTYQELAERFKVGKDTVFRMVNLFKETGSVDKKPHAGGRQAILSKDDGYNKLTQLYEEDNSLFDYEYQALMKERFDITLSPSAVNRAFAKLGFTKKK